MENETAVLRRPALQVAAEQCDAFADADQAVASARGDRSVAAVSNFHIEMARSIVNVDRRADMARVLANVGEAFLDDPVGGEVERGG